MIERKKTPVVKRLQSGEDLRLALTSICDVNSCLITREQK